MERLESRVAGAIIGFAIGDALGQPVEFVKPDRRNLSEKPVISLEDNPQKSRKAGQWTDDTQYLMIAMDAFNQYGAVLPEFVADKMAKLYTSRQTRGMGRATTASLQRYLQGVPLSRCGIKGRNAQGSGSLPRVVSYAITAKDVSRGAVESLVKFTHDDKEVFKVAAHLALYMNALVRNGKDTADALLKEKYSINPQNTQARSNDPRAISIWNSAMYFFQQSPDDYSKAVLSAVNFGGDTDTRAAITGALVGANVGYEKIPSHWVYRLEANSLLLSTANQLYKRMEK